MDERELGFTPRKPVPWLAPLLLLSTGLRTLGAVLFGAYLDKRELQNALPDDLHRQPGEGGELWLDYVADLGDGFDATYSVAYLLAQPELVVDGRELPRGQVLVMGGDQVYPTASGDEYENRMKGPYRAALPAPPLEGPRPTLFALPGNHDWYDGLTAFLRLFARRKDGQIGGWRTAQRRSYFAVELPANWWLFAIDEQFGAYIDDPQLVYFERAAARLGPGDRVVLMVPAPTWVKAARKPGAYDAVDYFVRTIVAPSGAKVRVMVSGDQHHYARYSGPDRELITCGGGGAYLLGTQGLPERITVPPEGTLTRNASPRQRYERAAAYPDLAASRRHAWGVFGRLPVRNPGFGTMLGIVHTLLMLAMLGATTRVAEAQRLFTIPLVAVLLVTVLGAVAFAQPPGADSDRHMRHWVLGVLHGAAHVGLAVAGTWVWLQFPFRDWPWPWPLAVAAVLYGPVIGYLAALLVSLYLLVASGFGVNVNELYAGQGIEHGKSFLRLHVARDGTLTIYPIGVDRICRKWVAAPDDPADAPWLRPAEPLAGRLIEPPVVVAPPA
ncbi:hypothetical protein J3R04_001455 [Spirilliplanes yamanashiensis]|nr:hypothetical protein [Spirilliplanes yamanashiensis]